MYRHSNPVQSKLAFVKRSTVLTALQSDLNKNTSVDRWSLNWWEKTVTFTDKKGALVELHYKIPYLYDTINGSVCTIQVKAWMDRIRLML